MMTQRGGFQLRVRRGQASRCEAPTCARPSEGEARPGLQMRDALARVFHLLKKLVAESTVSIMSKCTLVRFSHNLSVADLENVDFLRYVRSEPKSNCWGRSEGFGAKVSGLVCICVRLLQVPIFWLGTFIFWLLMDSTSTFEQWPNK